VVALGDDRATTQLLVVDDDDAMRHLLRRHLEQAGHVVVEAADLASAVELLTRARFDLVLVDLHLGSRSGLELFDARGVEMPATIVLSGAGDDTAMQRAYELGACDFLQKPLSGIALRHRVRIALSARQTMRDLERSKTRLASAQRLANVGSFEIDLSSGIVSCSDEARRIWGLPEGVVETRVEALAQIVAASERDQWSDWLLRGASGAACAPVEHRLVRFDATERRVRLQVERRVQAGSTILFGIVHDVTDLHGSEELAGHARHDELTGLGNRQQFLKDVERAILTAKESGHPLAVLVLDLDRFRDVNDSLGNAAGDHLLVSVATRLRERLRRSDVLARPARAVRPDSPTLRQGGDVFLVLCEALSDPRGAATIARRLLDALELPFLIGGREVYVTSSIGIAVGPKDDARPEQLLRCAEAAMFHAKTQGRASFSFYAPEMNHLAEQRIELETRLHQALERKEIEVWYQPRLRLSDLRIIGVEALVRWRHPELGLVSPEIFIPVAEKSGLIVRLGRFVLREACEQAHSWHGAGFAGLKVAVNVSAEQFRDDDLTASVAQVLTDTWLPPQCLELELTETILMRDIERTTRVLREIRGRGVQIAVDDFGIGYSSLNYLRSFPIDYLKIDRSFLRDVKTDPDDAAIAATIILMAHSLRLSVVAEGVENDAQVRFLREKRCDEVQGFLFGRPAPAAEVTGLLEAQLVAPQPPLPAAPPSR
jgi:diguanylate cyclase (GGDEF)-like protein